MIRLGGKRGERERFKQRLSKIGREGEMGGGERGERTEKQRNKTWRERGRNREAEKLREKQRN